MNSTPHGRPLFADEKLLSVLAIVGIGGLLAIFALNAAFGDRVASWFSEPKTAIADEREAPAPTPTGAELNAGTPALAPISVAAARTHFTPLGPPPIPADNPQTVDANGFPTTDDPKVQLGKLLFFDRRLSGDGAIACATCHNPALGWGDGQGVGMGYPGTVHWRNSQTIINAAYHPKLFWAGSSKSLESQARSAAKGAVGGNGEEEILEERLRQVPNYRERFKEVYGTPLPQLDDAWHAIAAYERTLTQPNTPFDTFLKGNETALSETARRGLALFVGKAKCITCHSGPLLTDQKYHNLGVPPNMAFDNEPMRQITFRYEQYAKGVTEEIYRSTRTDLGLYYRTKRKIDMGKFRTPSLRYVAHTAPYMHNGALASLEDVVRFYNAGGGVDPIDDQYGFATKSPLLAPLGLTNAEQTALTAFLKELSGSPIGATPPAMPPYGTFETN